MGMDYSQACTKVGVNSKVLLGPRITKQNRFFPDLAGLPSLLWLEKAKDFLSQCQGYLASDLHAMHLLCDRGFSVEAVDSFNLGWNPVDRFLSYEEWGLVPSYKDNGQQRKLWLPKGIVIPSKLKEQVVKLKIRRDAWHKDDVLPKYVEISGSMKSPSIYGDPKTMVAVIVEAEFDAMLIQQYVSDLCCCIAIGGAGKRPDFNFDHLLRNMPLILFSLDFDEAGKKAFQFWKTTYSTIRPWPVPFAKSPGDAFKEGLDIRKWIEIAFNRFKSSHN